MFCKVKFLPDNKIVKVHKGENLLTCAVKAGVYLNSSCGGEGICGRCRVRVKKGKLNSETTGMITARDQKKGYVLACLATVEKDVTIEIPAESRIDVFKVPDRAVKETRPGGIYSKAENIRCAEPVRKDNIYKHSPLASKLHLELPEPTLQDAVSDLERLIREIRKKADIPVMQTGLSNIKRLGRLLRESGWKLTVTLGKRNETTEIVSIEPNDTSKKIFGFAFDIGTTTVSGQLVDLNSDKVLGTKASFNKQAVFGSDVITRIICAEEEDCLEKLHKAVIDNINEIIEELVQEHKINLNDVLGMVCAGNTTMTHLLLKIDPKFIRREPYVSTANFVPVIRAAEAGIKINPRGLLYCVPGVATYVGGDITAGVLSSRMSEDEKVSLLIDIGTNGEIALGNKEWLVACAASAGPAFEGSGVTCGMRAIRGAIEDIMISEDFDIKIVTIENAKPIGICGSGYIALLAELFQKGIMTKDGKFNAGISDKRFKKRHGETEFIVVPKERSASGKDISITEGDIENLKRSKGAIYSAASMLLAKIGLSFESLDNIYIAGGFGTCMDMEKAIIIGLLPDLPREKFRFIGNSSLIGARETLLSYEAMKKVEEIARKMTYIDLSTEPKYMDEYVSSLFFPHTDLGRFPSSSIKRAS